MCVAIIEAKYRGEPGAPTLIPCADEDLLSSRVETLKQAENCMQIKIFRPAATSVKEIVWSAK